MVYLSSKIQCVLDGHESWGEGRGRNSHLMQDFSKYVFTHPCFFLIFIGGLDGSVPSASSSGTQVREFEVAVSTKK